MESYNFFDFYGIFQCSVYMLYEAIYAICLSIKFLFSYFWTFINSIPWIQLCKFIISLASFLASCIAIYLFLLKYCPLLWRIVLHTVEFNSSRWYGEQIFVVIENKSLASLTLKSIELIIDNEYIIPIRDFTEPFILKPFETIKIGTGFIHSLYIAEGKPVSLADLCNVEENLLINLYSTKSKYNTLWTGKVKEKKDYFSYKRINIYKYSFNKIPYDKDVRYAIQYLCNGTEKTLLVDKGGLCSDDIQGINALPQEVLISEQKLKDFLEKKFPFIKVFEVISLNVRGE